MTFVVKNDLSRFYNKVVNYSSNKSFANTVADKIAEKGKEIALQEWGGGAIIDVVGDGLHRSIVARDVDKIRPTIAYREFGTGIIGENTYEGKLPTQTISFEDRQGVKWETSGWQYAYRFKQTRRGSPFKGQVAKMPMFKTGQRLRAYIGSELKKDIKGD